MYNATPQPAFPAASSTTELPAPRDGRGPHPWRRRIAVITAAFALVSVTTACQPGIAAEQSLSPCPDQQGQRAQTLVITATATSAEPAPTLPPSVLARLTELGRQDDGCVLLVPPDGEPEAVSLTPRRGREVEVGSRREQARAQILASVEDRVAAMAARKDGLDLVGALRRAQQAHPVPGTVVVIGSGISTQEPVDLRRQGLGADGRGLATFMKERGWLDLTGWDVQLVGIGQAAGSQPAFSPPQQEKLRGLWLSICRANGARRCQSIETGPTSAPSLSRNKVPVVVPPSDETYSQKILLDVSTTFGISSDLLSRAANVALRAVVRKVENEDLVITITGRTDASTGTESGNLDLSRRRAERVRDRLLELGLPSNRIVWVDGVGSRDTSVAAERADPSLVWRARSVEIGFARRPQLP